MRRYILSSHLSGLSPFGPRRQALTLRFVPDSVWTLPNLSVHYRTISPDFRTRLSAVSDNVAGTQSRSPVGSLARAKKRPGDETARSTVGPAGMSYRGNAVTAI